MKVLLFPRLADDMMEMVPQILPESLELVVLESGSDEDTVVQALRSVDAFAGFIRPPIPSPRTYDAMAHLKLLQLISAGYDRLDIDVMRRLRVPVASNGGANSFAVAEHTFLLMLAVYRNLYTYCSATRAGNWRVDGVGQLELHEIAGKTVGLVGLGMIGRQVARRLRAFEATAIYYDVVRADPATEESLGVRYVEMPELLATSDIISLHVPLTAQTSSMIGREELRTMKRSAILVNTCRGGVVDSQALYEALTTGVIAAAGLDTVEPEPPPAGFPLLSLPNVTVTPHIAGITKESFPKRVRNAFANLKRVAEGQPPLWIVPELRDMI